jgi:hypothetical protein
MYFVGELMKHIIFLFVMGFATIAFADQLIIPSEIVDSNLKFSSSFSNAMKQRSKQGFFYVRFAAAEKNLARGSDILPGLGFGYRRLTGNGAADISISGIGISERKRNRFFWTAPKASYIHYLTPDAQKSTYAGGGLAWGGIGSSGQKFVGLISHVTVGYEFLRKQGVIGFSELNISQAAIKVYQKGKFPGPIVECIVGMGF